MSRAFIIVVALSMVILTSSVNAAAVKPLSGKSVMVAVAANFAETQEALSKAFTAATGAEIKNSYGATGKLYTQIKNGAPFEIFLSADADHPAKLETDGLAVPDTRFTYAIGRLALLAPKHTAPFENADFLKGTTVTHLAIANPETAPYGAAAVAALKKLALWDAVKDRVVQGENIAQTYQFIDSGSAEAGFVAYAQVKKRDASTYWLVPENLHEPLVQDAVLLMPGRDGDAAKAYLAFLKSDGARKIIADFGYQMLKQKP